MKRSQNETYNKIELIPNKKWEFPIILISICNHKFIACAHVLFRNKDKFIHEEYRREMAIKRTQQFNNANEIYTNIYRSYGRNRRNPVIDIFICLVALLFHVQFRKYLNWTLMRLYVAVHFLR